MRDSDDEAEKAEPRATQPPQNSKFIFLLTFEYVLGGSLIPEKSAGIQITNDIRIERLTQVQGYPIVVPKYKTCITVNEVQLGCRVVFKRGTDLERGTVRYAGRLVGKDGQYLGIELNTNTGNHDGTYQNHTYFKCKPKRGIFIPINKVQLVYPSV